VAGVPTTYDVIREAIINKHQVTGWYRGHFREMCPHTLGWKNGKRHALLYQFDGTSSSGLHPDGSRLNWRCLDVDDLSTVEARDGDWHSAPNHSRPQSCIDEVEVEVAF
jgi:hypothetical protein